MLRKMGIRLSYANIAATLALFLAMSGGAYAANRYIISSTKQISPKVLKQLTGKVGRTGANGTNGANGVQGPQGAQGAQGPAGAQGAQGPEGIQGAQGVQGAQGEPWTAGGTLPSEKTETGSWSIDYTGAARDNVFGSISFPIPLGAALAASNVHYLIGEPSTGTGEVTAGNNEITKVEMSGGEFQSGQEIAGNGIPAGTLIYEVNGEKETLELSVNAETTGANVELSSRVPAAATAACKGTVAAPTAVKGNLCVYATIAHGLNANVKGAFHPIFLPSGNVTVGGAGKSGAMLSFNTTGTEQGFAFGTWAVTAP